MFSENLVTASFSLTCILKNIAELYLLQYLKSFPNKDVKTHFLGTAFWFSRNTEEHRNKLNNTKVIRKTAEHDMH